MVSGKLKIMVYLASEVLIILGVFFTVCMILGVTRGLPLDPKSWEVVDITWEGGELAQLLNNDANLRNTLSHIKDTVFQHLEITPDRILERVRMWADYPLPKSAFPTIETFETFDRIAKHVRRIAGIHP